VTARARILLLACVVEGGLLLLAFPLGALLGAPPFDGPTPSALGLLAGLFSLVPLLVLFFACLRSQAAPCVRIRQLFERSLMPMFERSTPLDLMLISALAGLGEEALFRGVLQVSAAAAMGDVVGLLLASVLFGLAHAVTAFYVVLASVMGLYLGLLLLWSGDIWVPVVAHAAYDFFALLYLQRRRARHQSGVSMLLFCFGGASFLSTKNARLM
jgi:membrane protease YdiL (CAAX protease family)